MKDDLLDLAAKGTSKPAHGESAGGDARGRADDVEPLDLKRIEIGADVPAAEDRDVARVSVLKDKQSVHERSPQSKIPGAHSSEDIVELMLVGDKDLPVKHGRSEGEEPVRHRRARSERSGRAEREDGEEDIVRELGCCSSRHGRRGWGGCNGHRKMEDVGRERVTLIGADR